MNIIKHLLNPKMVLPAIAVAIVGIIGFNVMSQHSASAADCTSDHNAIVACGYSNPADLAQKVAASPELQAIYNNQFTDGYHIGDLNNFVANAKHATVYKDGRIVLDDGTVIATNGASIGRQTNNGNDHTITIGGHTYYWGYNSTAFASNALSAYVLINPDDHSLQFAALTECANAQWGTSPGYKCQMLNQTKVSDTTYSYVATPYVKNGAAVSKIVYDFGDGSSQTVTSNFGQNVTHTYAPGNYTAKATVYFTANGQTVSDTRAECTKPVSVPQPPKPVFVCDSLTDNQISRTKYNFTVRGSSKDATFVSASFDFGDGQTASGLKATSGEVVTTSHDYAKDGSYTATATLTYKEGVTKATDKCKVNLTVNQETCADKPNAPECQPPKTCANTPSLPECQPPKTCANTPSMEGCQTLPSTGPTEIIGSTLGLGSLVGAGAYYRNSRRDLLNTIFKKR